MAEINKVLNEYFPFLINRWFYLGMGGGYLWAWISIKLLYPFLSSFSILQELTINHALDNLLIQSILFITLYYFFDIWIKWLK